MAYNRTHKSILRVKSYLDAMVSARSSLEWAADEPQKLAFKLREAIAAARAFTIKDNTYAPYASLAARFMIKCLPGKVIALPRETFGVQALEALRSRMTVNGVSSLLEVMGAAIEHNAEELYFPSAENWPDADILKLYNWATQKSYFIIVGEGITLTRTDPGEAKWEPHLSPQ
jgi:hypothetical protein